MILPQVSRHHGLDGPLGLVHAVLPSVRPHQDSNLTKRIRSPQSLLGWGQGTRAATRSRAIAIWLWSISLPGGFEPPPPGLRVRVCGQQHLGCSLFARTSRPGTDGGIRTHTGTGLSRLPPAVGLRQHVEVSGSDLARSRYLTSPVPLIARTPPQCPLWDSNPHLAGFDSDASTNWTKGANTNQLC